MFSFELVIIITVLGSLYFPWNLVEMRPIDWTSGANIAYCPFNGDKAKYPNEFLYILLTLA